MRRIGFKSRSELALLSMRRDRGRKRRADRVEFPGGRNMVPHQDSPLADTPAEISVQSYRAVGNRVASPRCFSCAARDQLWSGVGRLTMLTVPPAVTWIR